MFYVITCLDCEPRLPIPFKSPTERGRWASEHTRSTGHEYWSVIDQEDTQRDDGAELDATQRELNDNVAAVLRNTLVPIAESLAFKNGEAGVKALESTFTQVVDHAHRCAELSAGNKGVE